MDAGVGGRVNWVEDDVETQLLAEEIQLSVQHAFVFSRSVYVQVGCPSQQAEGGYQARQSEAMVTVQVGKEDMPQAVKTELRTAHLQLRTLSAVYHIEFSSQGYYLRGGVVACGGQG